MMNMIHLEKKGIRALAIAESFKKSRDKSIIVGVVMRSDLVIDGIIFDRVTVRGDDATDAIIRMYNNLNRDDINIMILNGLIISMYNIIDIEEVYKNIKKPIIALTFEESEGLDEHIKRAFPYNYEEKLEMYHKLGKREELLLKTGYIIYIRSKGIDLDDSRRIINKFLLQGSIPEPIRVAKLIARACLKFISYEL
jgi:hypothetical protein